MSTVAFIRRMVEAGFSFEDAVSAAEAFEATVTEMMPAAPVRSAGAERQARYIERKRQQASQSVTNDASDAPLPSEVSPTPPSYQPSPDPTPFTPLKGGVSPAPPPGFEVFWQAYPSKVGKRKAEEAYRRALKRGGRTAEMLGAIAAAITSKRWRDGFVPNPATWLNEDRWLDQLPSPEPPKRVAFV